MIEFKPENLGFSPNEIPPQVEIAFRAVAYCRSLTDPQSIGIPSSEVPSRALSPMELGVEAAALNVIRNYLNGEMTYRDYTAKFEPEADEGRSPQLLPSRQRQKTVKPTPTEGTGSAEEAGK
jgi:hypothetical protein